MKRGRERGPRVNHHIRLPECRLVGEEVAYGVVSMDEARRIAEDQGLDLVEVSPTAKPPVVKLIDYGKFKYEAQKKANEQKKKQLTIALKEIQFRPNIDIGDLTTKLKRAEKFLAQGDKIKMVMQFRGREMAYREAGQQKFNDIIKQVEEMGAIVESNPKMMGNRIITIVAPDKKTYTRIAEESKKAAKERAEKKPEQPETP